MSWGAGTRLALAVGSTLLGLLLLEGATAVWLHGLATDEQFRQYATLEQIRARAGESDSPPGRFEPHRYVGYIGSRGFRDGDDHHDERGFRGEPFPDRKPPGEYRIVCMGGSTTYTTFVPEPGLAYPAQLQRALRDRGYEGVRVINAGVAGYTTYETLVSFLLRVRQLDPDLVILYHGINDVLARLVWPPSAYRGDNSGYMAAGGRWYESTPLTQRSNLARMVMLRLGWIDSANDLLANVAPPNPARMFWRFVHQVEEGTYPSGVFARTPVREMLRRNRPVYFRRNLEHLVAVAAADGVQPVLATFAVSHEKQDRFFTQPFVDAVQEQNGVLREIGRELSVPVFDYAAVAPTDAEFYWDATHVLQEGARRKAELFADFLISQGLMPEMR